MFGVNAWDSYGTRLSFRADEGVDEGTTNEREQPDPTCRGFVLITKKKLQMKKFPKLLVLTKTKKKVLNRVIVENVQKVMQPIMNNKNVFPLNLMKTEIPMIHKKMENNLKKSFGITQPQNQPATTIQDMRFWVELESWLLAIFIL